MVIETLERSESEWWRDVDPKMKEDVFVFRGDADCADTRVRSSPMPSEQTSILACTEDMSYMSASKPDVVALARAADIHVDSELGKLRAENARLAAELGRAERAKRRAALNAEQEREDFRQEVANLQAVIAEMVSQQPALRPVAVAAGVSLPPALEVVEADVSRPDIERLDEEYRIRVSALEAERAAMEAENERLTDENRRLEEEKRTRAVALDAEMIGLEAENERLAAESKRLTLELTHRKWLGAEKDMFMTQLAASGRLPDTSMDSSLLQSHREAELVSENTELAEEKARLSDELARTERERRRLALLEAQCRAELEQIRLESNSGLETSRAAPRASESTDTSDDAEMGHTCTQDHTSQSSQRQDEATLQKAEAPSQVAVASGLDSSQQLPGDGSLWDLVDGENCGSGSTKHPPEQRPEPPSLPYSWQALWSEEHRSYYFWHTPTDLVTWKAPSVSLQPSVTDVYPESEILEASETVDDLQCAAESVSTAAVTSIPQGSHAQEALQDVVQQLAQQQMNLRGEFVGARQAYDLSMVGHSQQLKNEIAAVQERCSKITTEHQNMMMEQCLQLRGDAADTWSDYARTCEERVQKQVEEVYRTCSHVNEEHQQFVLQQRSQLSDETLGAYTDFAAQCEQQLSQVADSYSEQVRDRQNQLRDEVTNLHDECHESSAEQQWQRQAPVLRELAAACELQLSQAAQGFSEHVAKCQMQLCEEVRRLQNECSRVAAEERVQQQHQIRNEVLPMGLQLPAFSTHLPYQQQWLQNHAAASLDRARVDAMRDEIRRLVDKLPASELHKTVNTTCIEPQEPVRASRLAVRPAVSASCDDCCSSSLPQMRPPPRSTVGELQRSLVTERKTDGSTTKNEPVSASPDAWQPALAAEVQQLLEEERELIAQAAATRYVSEKVDAYYEHEANAAAAESYDQLQENWRIPELDGSKANLAGSSSSLLKFWDDGPTHRTPSPYGDDSSSGSSPSRIASLQLGLAGGRQRRRGRSSASDNVKAEMCAQHDNYGTATSSHSPRRSYAYSRTPSPSRSPIRRRVSDSALTHNSDRSRMIVDTAVSPSCRAKTPSPMSMDRRKSILEPSWTGTPLKSPGMSPARRTASSLIEGFFYIVMGEDLLPKAEISWPPSLHGPQLEQAVVREEFCPSPNVFSSEGFGNAPFVFSLRETTINADADPSGVLYGCVCSDIETAPCDPSLSPSSSPSAHASSPDAEALLSRSSGVLCIISKIPIFSFLFSVLRLLRIPCRQGSDKAVSIIPRINKLGLVEGLTTVGVDVSDLESQVNHLRFELPLGKSPICGWAPMSDPISLLPLPDHDQVTRELAQWQAAWGLQALFRQDLAKNRAPDFVGDPLAKLLACLLLEQKVLLLGDASRCSTVALVLRALLWPFRWYHPFFSAPLPASVVNQIPILEAPYPVFCCLADLPGQWNYRTYYDLPTDVVTGILQHGHIYASPELETLGGLKGLASLKLPGNGLLAFRKAVSQAKKKYKEEELDVPKVVEKILETARSEVYRLGEVIKRYVAHQAAKMSDSSMREIEDATKDLQTFIDWLGSEAGNTNKEADEGFYRTFFQTQMCIKFLEEELFTHRSRSGI